ncbi:hypothetical protein HOG48_06625 [Candidatus Peregrinibacteria bacterium]|jgi:hypothetical protein|nr:hypothetical protein [Candidatus Peregrinibacteria bacterium]
MPTEAMKPLRLFIIVLVLIVLIAVALSFVPADYLVDNLYGILDELKGAGNVVYANNYAG